MGSVLDSRLYSERSEFDFSGLGAQSTVFPEDRSSSIFRQVATYPHPDFTTEMVYQPTVSSGVAYAPDRTLPAPRFEKRDEALYQESLSRLKARAHLPVSERYSGYEDGLMAKVKGVAKRAFYIITRLGVQRGLAAYDLHLAGQARTLAFANYSAKPAANFQVKMIPRAP